MNTSGLAKFDLNLIIAFQVLMEEKNVTRAAERLFVSQPAMSNSLARLRELFDDPLFTRASRGIIPTPKAESLYKTIPDLLEKIDQLVSFDEFRPETYTGKFRIGCNDGFCGQLLKLLSSIRESAPNIKIEHVDIHENYAEELILGKLDYVIHFTSEAPKDITIHRFDPFPIKCLMRKSHPLSKKKRLTTGELLQYPHVRKVIPHLTSSGMGFLDEVLEKKNLQRNIIFESPVLSALLQAVLGTDCLYATGRTEELLGQQSSEYHFADLPKELASPMVDFALLQHVRTTHHPAHQWFREQLLSVLAMP